MVMISRKEISTSKRVNRKFHNECVRHTIESMRYHAALAGNGSDKSAALYRSYRCDLIKGLADRRNFKYLR